MPVGVDSYVYNDHLEHEQLTGNNNDLDEHLLGKGKSFVYRIPTLHALFAITHKIRRLNSKSRHNWLGKVYGAPDWFVGLYKTDFYDVDYWWLIYLRKLIH